MRKTILIFAAIMTISIGPGAALAATCPGSIYYSNGSYLKSGSTFYYNNGSYARSGSSLYHSNGTYLRSGSSFYYSNGSYFKSGSTLYYPNGQYLRSGSTWYHDNGNYLKSGSTFYHSNGQYARSGSSLYRADGSRTDFPVNIRASVGSEGYYDFRIEKNSETITPELNNFVSANQVTARLVTSGDTFSTIFTLNTGHSGEDVIAEFDGSGNLVSCVTGGINQPDNFRLNSSAATVDVVVKSGYDPAEVKRVLQQALDSL